MLRALLRWTCLILMLAAGAAHALTAEQVKSIAAGDSDERIAALNAVVASGDPKLEPFLQALLADEVKVAGDKVFVVHEEKVTDAATGAAATLPEGAEDVSNNNRVRGVLQSALAALRLFSADAAERAAAIAELTKVNLEESQLPLVEKAIAAETDLKLKEALERMRATVLVSSSDKAKRLTAAQELGASHQAEVAGLLQDRLGADAETDPEVRAALQASLGAVRGRLAWGERIGVIFTGVSLGSVLLLAALGPGDHLRPDGRDQHGARRADDDRRLRDLRRAELLRHYLPGFFDAYVIVAIPIAFLASGLVGAALERSVIRFLYGRPLETLLATWGISLMLQQGVRSFFGAQNVPVENPSWLSGGVAVMSNLTLPFNRIAIIVFAGLVVAGVALLIAKTRLGLFVRGVTQNRRMAACVGVDTARIDTMAFALGAGIAGLAGCALSQIGNVGRTWGRTTSSIRSSSSCSAASGNWRGPCCRARLGVANKLLEGWQGAVLAKIMVLVLIVVFIQKRPSGLFAMKGRSAEA